MRCGMRSLNWKSNSHRVTGSAALRQSRMNAVVVNVAAAVEEAEAEAEVVVAYREVLQVVATGSAMPAQAVSTPSLVAPKNHRKRHSSRPSSFDFAHRPQLTLFQCVGRPDRHVWRRYNSDLSVARTGTVVMRPTRRAGLSETEFHG